MIIGIDASRAFIRNRTGIEEYSYQTIKHLRDKLNVRQVVLYIRKNQMVDFELPENWKIKVINWPRLWTQVGLSLEMFFHPVDVLFVPAHTVPIIHPKKTIVTIHGLEFEVMPKAYSLWGRFYMRLSIKNSCRWAKAIIAVSENTKKDLIKLYDVPGDEIEVIYEGCDCNSKFRISNFESHAYRQAGNHNFEIKKLEIESKFKIQNSKFLLFVGRLEERKNIAGIIESFEIFKEKYNLPYKLVLAGGAGYRFCDIESKIKNSKYKKDIIQLGFVKDEDKFDLISQAAVFMFPTFYEGFGIPALEAQSVGVPVITSNLSSMPEVVGDSAILVDPQESGQIAERIYELISNKSLRDDIIKRGYENVAKFSWEKCAKEIAELINN